MDPIPDDMVRSGGIYHRCMKELQQPGLECMSEPLRALILPRTVRRHGML